MATGPLQFCIFYLHTHRPLFCQADTWKYHTGKEGIAGVTVSLVKQLSNEPSH